MLTAIYHMLKDGTMYRDLGRNYFDQKLEHREQRIALEEFLEGVRQEAERVERLEPAIREAVPEWSLAEVATALQAMCGSRCMAEIGDLSAFKTRAT